MSKSPGKIEGWLATCVASIPTESWRVAILFNIGLSNKFISIFKSSFVAACKEQSTVLIKSRIHLQKCLKTISTY